MKQLFTRNLAWKLLSLLMAIALWIAVAREPEVATSLAVPVEFRNPPADLDIEGNVPDRVRLDVRGPSGRFASDNTSAVAVVLDLSDARPGERTYSIRGRNLNLPSGVVFYGAVPSQLTLHFEQLVFKDAPVEPVYVNKPPGYRIASQQFVPTKVRMRGSLQRVQAINLIRTDPMTFSGVVGEQILHTHLNVGDPQVRILDAPADITVRVKIEKIVNGGGR
jgi:YbbR domain-containing protein